MTKKQSIRDYGIKIGILDTGERNTIADVNGVKVGHVTLNDGDRINTGVTAILPHEENVFLKKPIAACHVINGFGKSIGLMQIEELGTLETPIILTNTFNAPTAAEALIEHSLHNNEDIGIKTGTVNPVVGECNDAYLNDIRGQHVNTSHVLEAIHSASIDFEQGDVGAGTGMSCYGLKGGIGSASRVIKLGKEKYTLGVLVLSNFGQKKDLIIKGSPIGEEIEKQDEAKDYYGEKGSVMVIMATDLPCSSRQLKRLCKRVSFGLSRTGAYAFNGSGDVVIGFSTAAKIEHYPKKEVRTIKVINEENLNQCFRAVVESTEEAVLNSMTFAKTVVGRNGHKRSSLNEYLNELL
ncbi:P1 family peptidase [Proteinivorax hydrogeniformans]|uniref:P1 family peptidase n=1 Tax=Proteinivorax hydrogeniformans TaxID=1826727 RepID=A0AAU8HSN7_9FIRM